VSSPAVASACSGTPGVDVWYRFTASTHYPVIALSSIGTDLRSGTGTKLQLYSGACGGLSSMACVTGTGSTLTLNTATAVGGAGLTPGTTYFVRVYHASLTATTNTSTTWGFTICVTDPTAGRIDFGKSYVNISKGLNGGTVDPGDTLEIRATFVVFSGTMDSLAFYDTLTGNDGLRYVPNSMALRTNEGKLYKGYLDPFDNADAAWIGTGADTTIRINMGLQATQSARGKLRNSSRPSFYGGTCIIMATYRAVVYGSYNSKVNFGGGAFTSRDTITGLSTKINFKKDSIMIYQSPGLCPNAVSPTNAVGVEFNGTFGTPATGAPLARNRTSSPYVAGYVKQLFQSGSGPQDYYYGIANNTSARYTTLQNWGKADGSSPSYRVHTVWDIIGDHTNASNPVVGNPPCDTTQPVSASNPCGYMLVINSAYKTDTAFQYTVTNLCPNTYYEISAWVRNVCYKCGCDSTGTGAGSAGYIPLATGDSSGVQPNLAFEVNGTHYYTTGNIRYQGVGPTTSDASNRWVKKGFTYLTGSSETSFTLTIRNNAPGGGGNDWALDDIAVATCLPRMSFSPSLTPTMCDSTYITLVDTVRSYFNNYNYYQWQRSTDGGATWTNLAGASGVATPAWNGSAWEYLTGFVVTPPNATLANNGDRYRVIVATTAANLTNVDCQVTDGTSITTLSVIDCGIPLKTELLSFTGKVINQHGDLLWTTSKETQALQFDVERSDDGISFRKIATINSYNNYQTDVNRYTFTDPAPVSGNTFYRILMTNSDQKKKYSRTIRFNKEVSARFELVNVVNPFYDKIDIDVSVPEDGKIEVYLSDMFGKTIRKSNHFTRQGINSLYLFNTETLTPGMYVLQVSYNGTVIGRKVIKKGTL
jgi:trimeric autotransporter adhesin